jgi:hypothetical protein
MNPLVKILWSSRCLPESHCRLPFPWNKKFRAPFPCQTLTGDSVADTEKVQDTLRTTWPTVYGAFGCLEGNDDEVTVPELCQQLWKFSSGNDPLGGSPPGPPSAASQSQYGWWDHGYLASMDICCPIHLETFPPVDTKKGLRTLPFKCQKESPRQGAIRMYASGPFCFLFCYALF